jgi:hypothetical protein
MSETGIEKFRAEETVRLSYYKNRGEISRIVQETNYSVQYVTKIVKKIKNKRNKNVDFHIASAISSEIMSGHEARVAHIRILLNKIMDEEKDPKSSCCKSSVRTHTWDGGKHFVCSKCNEECLVVASSVNSKQYMNLLKMWSLEDLSLAEFAEKMGLTFKEEAPKIKQNNFFVMNKTQPKQTSNNRKKIESKALNSEEQEIISDAQELTPVAREKLRKQLEMRALQAAASAESNEENGTK